VGRTKHNQVATTIKYFFEEVMQMLVKIRSIYTLDDYLLITIFDNNKIVEYDMKEDIQTLPNYSDLKSINGLWQQAQIDKSRTCVFWNDYIDLPCDTIYEYGKEIKI